MKAMTALCVKPFDDSGQGLQGNHCITNCSRLLWFTQVSLIFSIKHVSFFSYFPRSQTLSTTSLPSSTPAFQLFNLSLSITSLAISQLYRLVMCNMIDFIICQLCATCYHQFFFFSDSVSLCITGQPGTGHPPVSAFSVSASWAQASKLQKNFYN